MGIEYVILIMSTRVVLTFRERGTEFRFRIRYRTKPVVFVVTESRLGNGVFTEICEKGIDRNP